MDTLKLGYEHIRASRTTFRGQPVYCIIDSNVARLGADWSVDSTTTLYMNDKFKPIWLIEEETDKDKESGSDRLIEARFTQKTVECTITRNQAVSHKSIPIPKHVDLISGNKYKLHLTKLFVGMKFKDCSFDTDDLSFSTDIERVVKKEVIQVNSKSYETLVVKSDNGTNWCLPDCSELKSDLPGTHIVRIAEPREKAENIDKSTISIASGIETQPKLPDDALITELTVQIYGLQDNTLAVSGTSQTAKYLPEDKAIEYHVSSRLSGKQPSKLPIKGKEFKEWLSDSEGIEVSDESIKAQARKIVGNETDALSAAMKLMNWVSDNIHGNYATQVPLSAVEILKAKSGDCKHYARLYTALARAVGIPTREVSGLAYGDGRFRGHEWTESYIGVWIPVDPAFGSEIVDATHIKLASDDDSDTRATLSLISGRELKAKVISYKALVVDEKGNTKTIRYYEPTNDPSRATSTALL